MSDKIPNEIVIPRCSKYEVIDTELNAGKNRKRELSISESEYEYNDQTDWETSTNKRSLYKSNALCERTSEQSLSDVIQKLTQQIEHIEKHFKKCQNVTKNTEVNDISCDDELIYQPPNKIIKYDNDVISVDFCNSDENSYGSTNKINKTKHVNKKIKLDKNIIFQKDDSERDSKSLTNEEVERLLSYEIDGKIIYDNEDNTRIETHNVQTIEDSDSVSFLDQADKFNTSEEHVFNESMLDNNKISFSTEDQSMVQSNDCSKSSMNQSDVFVNVSEILEMCDDNIDNSISQDDFLDLTKCDNDEIILDHENCTSVTNEDINCTTDFKKMIVQERKSCESIIYVDDQETVCETLNNLEGKIFEPSHTVDDLHDVDILEAVHPKIIDFLDLTKCDNGEIILDQENCTSVINEGINCTTDFRKIIVQERKSCESIIYVDDQETVCETLNNLEGKIFEPSHTVDDSHDVNILEAVHPKIIDFLDLTKCNNDEIILDHENCTIVTNEDINCTTKIIVQERKSCESIIYVDDQETVCETLNNLEGKIFEPSHTVDDSHDFSIGGAVHPKISNCENNFNQKDLLDINEYVNEEIMLENENGISKMNLENKNKGISKKRKNQDANVSMVNEGKRSDQTDKLTLSMNHGVDITIFNNKEIDNLTERHFTNDEVFVMPVEVTDGVYYNSLSPNCCCVMDDTTVDNFEVSTNEINSQSSVTGDQFISNTFYFGTENCRDVSVHTIHSLDAYEMNNSLRNNTTVRAMENNDSLVSLNEEIENSIVELYCNSDNTTLSGIKNKSYSNEKESAGGLMKHTIEDIAVSLESSNSYRHDLINLSKSVNDFENVLEPVDESCMNSESITTHSNTKPLYELQRTVSEIYENNNNAIDTSDKSISEDKLIESRRDYEKFPSDFDKTIMTLIVIENNDHKINDSVNIPEKGGINISIELMLEKSILDNDKIGFSTEDRSLDQNNDCSERSINQSAKFLNVDDIIFMPETCEDNNNRSDQHDFLDLTKYDNDETILDHENCTCVTNKGINCTTHFDNVNSEIRTDSDQNTQYSGDSIHETDFRKIIVQERKSCESIIYVDDQETVCETLNNLEGKIFEPSPTVDDSHDFSIGGGVHPKIDTHCKSISDRKFIESRSDNENIVSDHDKTTMSQIIIHKDFSESSLNRSAEFLNVGETLVPEMCNANVDYRLFDYVNSDIQTDSDQNTQYLGDSIHETDFGKIIVQERKSCESTINVDDQETVRETLNNQEGNILEPSHTVDDSHDVNILEAVHPKIIDCENSFNQKDLLDINKYVNEEIMLENENVTCKSNLEQNNKGTLKILTTEEEEMLTKLVNNEDDELRIVSDCTDKTTVSQTCEDYINENISKKMKNQDDLLVVTHVSDENVCMVNERKRNVSFNSNDTRQIQENSNDDSEHLNDSLLFKPSDRDRYGIECEAYEKSISQPLNNLENNVSNKEVIPQCNTPTSIHNLVSSSYLKDYEDNVIDFYDCELSSIENSDVEDNLLLSFVKDTSMDNCIFEKNQNKLNDATNSTSNEQTCDTNLKIPNLGSPSESCNNLTNVVSLIHSPGHDHQYNKIISTSMSKTEMQMNPDADDKLESVNSNNTITSCNAISSINDSDNIHNIQSNNLCIDQGNFNENQNLEDSIKSYNQNNKNKSISESNTHQNIKKFQKSYGDNESETESSMKITGNCTIPKSNIEEIPKTNIVQSSSSVIDQSEIDKKKYLDEIIKNEQLFNKFNEKLDVNESAISPFISQSLAKSTNLKGALEKKAAAHINIHDMGEKALSTYLTQQTMTLDVLEVLHKSLDTCPSSGILMEDPEGLVVPLMPHQKHAIAWLIWRESQEPHGGILADDMGLGKTLSMISLILKSKEKKQETLLPVVSIDNGRNDVINGGTLVVCPASLINQWETEVKTKLKSGLLKVFQYYGVNRSCSALELAKIDLVITSYNTVMWDQKIQLNTSPLYRIKWDRIILDEGHIIRNQNTQTSVAVCNIKSLNRWAITGTPIHNKEADFFTLLKFVRCKPFDDWAVWKRWVGNNDDAGKHRLSLLVKTLMLRRTKTELTQFTTFNLPKKEINTIEIELSKEERNAYENLLQFSSKLFTTYLYDRVAKEKVFDPSIKVQCKVQYFQEQNQDKEEVFKDHPELLKLFRQFKKIEEIQTYHILVLLLRLRQICCHPALIRGPITEESIKKEDNMESIPEDDTDVFNNDSYNENTDIDTLPNNIDLSELMSCLTLENEPVKKKPVIESNIFQKSWISTKVKKICDLVNQKLLIDGNREKAIIVSQWPSFLYLIQKNLAHYNVKMEMFSGAIPIPKRNKIIREFNQPNSGPQILLLSLNAGGVGLNLMAANHMFLVDIHWNPQLEAQVCDRIYRVGQTKPVNVYKFICSNTIETRIMNIQTHKLQMADNLFKGTSNTSKITIDDLKQIFQFH